MSDFSTWSDHIRARSLSGKHDDVLSLFVSKVRYPYSFRPDHVVLQAALKSCALLPAFRLGRALHSVAVKLGHLSCLCVSKGLLNVYAKAKAFNECKVLFDEMPKYDAVVWNIVLAGLSGSKNCDNDVMRLVYDMHSCGKPKPSPVTVAIVLPVCARLERLNAGRSVHSYAMKSGWGSDTLVGNALISMYAKCGMVHDDAYASFSDISDKDVVSWNAIISGFAENGFQKDAFALFRQMLLEPVLPNYSTIASILPVLATFDKYVTNSLGRQLHAYVLKRSELRESAFVANAFVSFYLRMGLLQDAKTIFDGMESRDHVSWNAVISGFASHGDYTKAIYLFQELLSEGILMPDSVTLISVLPACAHLLKLQIVKQIHGYSFQHRVLQSDTAICNALIKSYAKCEDLDLAFRTFRMMLHRDIISWNSILDAVAWSRCEWKLVGLLHDMLVEGTKPDPITILTLIQFYASVCGLCKIKEAHCYLLRAQLCQTSTQPTLGNALLDAYAKCGSLEYAQKIFWTLMNDSKMMHDLTKIGYEGSVACKDFKGMSQTDLMTYNLMLRAFVENDGHEQAFSLLFELKAQHTKPDAVTIMNILLMCSKLASVELVRQCHGYAVGAGIEDIKLKGMLIDVYAKCGSVSLAEKLFWSSDHKDLVMFTALIGGFAMHGMGTQALIVFNQMLKLRMRPDHVVLLAVLSACIHSGLVDDGLRIFHSIENVHGMKPTMEQYGCIVDLLSRHGRLKDAYTFVLEMPIKPNANIWSILLNSCRTYHEIELGKIVADHLLRADEGDIGSYVTMSNLQAVEAKWDGVLDTRKLMKTMKLKKPTGCSWIE